MTLNLAAQNVGERDAFGLTKQGSHYFFTADVNNAKGVTVMLESGIPAMLVDSAFAFSRGVLDGLELMATADNEKINLGGKTYTITHKAKGLVRLGRHTSYRGEVFVLPNYAKKHEVAIPVQFLHNDHDGGSSIVSLDLSCQRLQMLDRKTLDTEKSAYTRTKINHNSYMGMPAVKTKLSINDGKRERVMKGNFVIDLGNPALLFLLHQNKHVQRFLSDNSDMELQQARNPRGEVVAEAIVTQQCRLCSLTFPNAVVAVTKALPRFTSHGNIGLKFFEAKVVLFDFDKSYMYVKSASE